MAVFSVCTTLIKKVVEEPKPFLNELLFYFTNQGNRTKVALDDNNIVMNKYVEIGDKNPGIATWLQLMSIAPKNWQSIGEIDNSNMDCECELFLRVADKIAGVRKIIVDSNQCLSEFNFRNESNVAFNGNNIKVFTKESALTEFKSGNYQTHNGSGDNVAGDKFS